MGQRDEAEMGCGSGILDIAACLRLVLGRMCDGLCQGMSIRRAVREMRFQVSS